MTNKEQITKTTDELNLAEKEILDEHTKKTAQQLNHFLNLKKKKLYLKKSLKKENEQFVKQELKNLNK